MQDLKAAVVYFTQTLCRNISRDNKGHHTHGVRVLQSNNQQLLISAFPVSLTALLVNGNVTLHALTPACNGQATGQIAFHTRCRAYLD